MRIGDHYDDVLSSGVGVRLVYTTGGSCHLTQRHHDLGGVHYSDVRMKMEDIWYLAEKYPRPPTFDTWAEDVFRD